MTGETPRRATVADLTKDRLGEEDFLIPALNLLVTVRGLSRGTVLRLRKATDREDNIDGVRALTLECKMLAAAMVDPVMTEKEVQEWQEKGAAGELDPLIEKIQSMSAMTEGAGKENYKSV